MLNKTAIAVMVLSASGLANAAMYAPEPAPTCSPGDVTIPCEAKAWDIGIQALYLKQIATANGAYYLGDVNNDGFDTYNELDRDWGWGFRLEGSYHFGPGNDVSVNWTHYDRSTDQTFAYGNPPVYNPLTYIPLDGFRVEHNSRLEQVNMVFGQHVDVGMNKNMRYYAGLQYALIRTEDTVRTTAFDPVFQVNQHYSRNIARKFSGLGPHVGTDYAYDFGNGFSFTANAAASLLFGTSKNYLTNFITPLAPGIVLASTRASHKMIVPEVEAKLGANYAHAMSNGTLTLEAGYQVMNYFNAVTLTPAAGVTTTDFGLHGPYFGFKWLGNT